MAFVVWDLLWYPPVCMCIISLFHLIILFFVLVAITSHYSNGVFIVWLYFRSSVKYWFCPAFVITEIKICMLTIYIFLFYQNSQQLSCEYHNHYPGKTFLILYQYFYSYYYFSRWSILINHFPLKCTHVLFQSHFFQTFEVGLSKTFLL